MTSKEFDYSKVKAELDAILQWFEEGDSNINEALIKYQQAESLIEDLEKYLNEAKAQVEQVIKKTDLSK